MHPFTQGFKKKWFAFALHSEHSLQGWQSPKWYLVTPWIVCCSVPAPWLLESCYGTWWCQIAWTLDCHPALQQHPIKHKPGWRTHGVPMVLHGDEVPVVGIGKIWSRSSLCFSDCSLLANAMGGTMDDVQLYCWSVFEKFCVPSTPFLLGTMDTFFKIMQWSFQAMYMGVWPDTDWTGSMYHHSTPEGRKAGTPLAGGYFGVLLQLSGDLDYFHKWLGLPQSTTHSKPCALCKAQYSGTNSWLDNRPGSPWQNTILTAANWQSWWTTDCSLFKLPGMTSMSIALDLMHNFYLGWLQYFFGSVFWLLCFECLDLAPLSNLHTIWNFIKEAQQGDNSRHKYRHRLDKLSMFVKKTGFPKLKGRASDIRGLDKALLSCWQQFMIPENMQHKQVEAFLKLLLEVNDTLNDFSPKYGFWKVPQEHWQNLKQKACAMAQLHVQLSEHYQELGVSLFNITSKTHFTLHSIFLAKDLHPSLTWCFKGESMMKKMQTVFKSCLAGNKHFNVGRMSAVKFRHLLYIKIKEHRDWWNVSKRWLLNSCHKVQYNFSFNKNNVHQILMYVQVLRSTRIQHQNLMYTSSQKYKVSTAKMYTKAWCIQVGRTLYLRLGCIYIPVSCQCDVLVRFACLCTCDLKCMMYLWDLHVLVLVTWNVWCTFEICMSLYFCDLKCLMYFWDLHVFVLVWLEMYDVLLRFACLCTYGLGWVIWKIWSRFLIWKQRENSNVVY